MRSSLAWLGEILMIIIVPSRRCVNSHQAVRAAAIFLTAPRHALRPTRAGNGSRRTCVRSIDSEYDLFVYESLYSPPTKNIINWNKRQICHVMRKITMVGDCIVSERNHSSRSADFIHHALCCVNSPGR